MKMLSWISILSLLLVSLWAPAFATCPYGLTGVTCVAWGKASSLVGLSDGDPVPTWTDLSGSENDAANTGTPATYKAGILGGKAVVRFSGASDEYYTAASTLALPQPYTVCVVGSNNNVVDNGTFFSNVSGGLWIFEGFNGGTQLASYAGTGIFQTVSAMSNYAIMCGVFNGASSVSSYNGTTATGDVGTSSGTGLSIGIRGDTLNQNLNGDIAEWVVITSDLSTANRQLFEGGAACEYGMQASLPVGHPYKSSCLGSGAGKIPKRVIAIGSN